MPIMNTDKARAFYSSLKDYVAPFLSVFGIYILWICIHYISPRLYISYCVPATIVGFVYSPFLAQSPHWLLFVGLFPKVENLFTICSVC